MLHSRRRLHVVLVALLLLASFAARSGLAAELPPLPLPDCAANGLVPNLSTDCEGTLASYPGPAAVPRPGPNGITLAISTRDVDFRLDEDLPGSSQTITFTYTTPGLLSGPGPEGGTYYSIARLDWPDTVETPFDNDSAAVRGGASQRTNSAWRCPCERMARAAASCSASLARKGYRRSRSCTRPTTLMGSRRRWLAYSCRASRGRGRRSRAMRPGLGVASTSQARASCRLAPQRGNASATPPSTGIVAPVVGVWFDARNTTALPT
jgi:hypothetical protein